MMNKRIRSMIDEIFANMKMSAENLALRDELMANAQARYEDSLAGGKTEDEAFAEVAASLGDVHALLEEMNGEQTPEKAEPKTQEKPEEKPEAKTEETPAQETADESEEAETEEAETEKAEAGADRKQAADANFDLGDTLNRAFSALSDLGKSVVPQAKKFVRDVDGATGGVILEVGRAVNKGVRDAQKAAGEAIDKLSGKTGEIVIDFGKPARKQSAGELRREAENLRAQASLKQVAGDPDGAKTMNEQADALEAQALAAEQEEAMEAARRAARQQTAADAADAAQTDDAPMANAPIDDGQADGAQEPVYTADGEVDEDAFSKAVDGMVRDAERLAQDAMKTAQKVVRGVDEMLSSDRNDDDDEDDEDEDEEDEEDGGNRLVMRFPVAGLRKVNVKLNADDVIVEPIDGHDIEVEWETDDSENKPDVRMEDHTLFICRTTPDAFKTFFSVFKKEGGEVTLRVPRGYAADYEIATTSGDVRLRDVDVDDVKIGTVSGDVRFEPEAAIRAKVIDVQTVSGDAAVSVCAEQVKVTTVSGDQFVSCDAGRVESSVVSGDAHVEGACDEWEISSVSGGAELICTAVPTKKIHVSTMSGDARLSLPGDIRGFVAEISSVSGQVVNAFGPNRYGTCALPIRMNTMSGSLLINRL